MYQIIQISKYNNITTYGYGQNRYFTDFTWNTMSSGEKLNIIEFVRTGGRKGRSVRFCY